MKLVLTIDNKCIVQYDTNHCLIGSKNKPSGSNLILNDPLCSDSHAILYEEDDGVLFVKSLDDQNETSLNGSPIQEALVQIGDEIRIGTTLITVSEFVPSSY